MDDLRETLIARAVALDLQCAQVQDEYNALSTRLSETARERERAWVAVDLFDQTRTASRTITPQPGHAITKLKDFKEGDYADAVTALLQVSPVDCPNDNPIAREDAEEEHVSELVLAVLDCLVLLDTDVPETAWMQEVLELLDAVPRPLRMKVFWSLDNRPGNWSDLAGTRIEWHWKLRRTRNDPNFGKWLFSILELKDAGRDVE